MPILKIGYIHFSPCSNIWSAINKETNIHTRKQITELLLLEYY